MYVYLHELWARQLQEDSVGLLGARTCEQRLSRPGWAVQQNALGRADADVVEHVLVGHGQHHRLDKLLNLLVQPWRTGRTESSRSEHRGFESVLMSTRVRDGEQLSKRCGMQHEPIPVDVDNFFLSRGDAGSLSSTRVTNRNPNLHPTEKGNNYTRSRRGDRLSYRPWLTYFLLRHPPLCRPKATAIAPGTYNKHTAVKLKPDWSLTSDVAVLLRGLLVHLHGLDAIVVFRRQLLEDEVAVLVRAHQVAGRELLRRHESRDREVDRLDKSAQDAINGRRVLRGCATSFGGGDATAMMGWTAQCGLVACPVGPSSMLRVMRASMAALIYGSVFFSAVG